MFLKIIEFIAFFGFNKLFENYSEYLFNSIQELEYLILCTMGSSSVYFQESSHAIL